MAKIQLAKGVYWVGAIDWNIRNFHGYTTNRGTTYNAFLIVDKKIALIDTVKHHFFPEMLSRIKEIIDPAKIDYIVSNHVEMDHSGSLPQMMAAAPNAELITTEKFGEAGLKKHFGIEKMTPVKEGDTIDLGKRKLVFVPIPMLHWPDSMVTYCPQEEILFSSDAFGQHLATAERFDDEVDPAVIMQEAAKYYANILMLFGHLIPGAIKKLGGLSIKTIAPDHGVIWRSDPGKIISAYTDWSAGKTKNKAVVVYDSMWHSTEKMAVSIVDGLVEGGVTEVKSHNLTSTEKSDVMTDILDAKAIIVGSPTLNNGMFPSIAAFLCYLKGLKPKNKIGAVFGSFGWGGGAAKGITYEMELAGIELVEPEMTLKWVPEVQELDECHEFGKKIAAKMK